MAKDCVVISMPELDKQNMGGTMRLGSRKTIFQPGSEWAKIRALYGGGEEIEERHRHRYEVNPAYIERFEAAGLHFVGKDETGQRMEIFEMKDHPYFVGMCLVMTARSFLSSFVLLVANRVQGTQFHAEYQSKVLNPSVSDKKETPCPSRREKRLTKDCRAHTSASLLPAPAASTRSSRKD